MSVQQKLGIILESRVVQKLSLETNVFTKNWSSKLIFFFKKFKIGLKYRLIPVWSKSENQPNHGTQTLLSLGNEIFQYKIL